LPTLKRYSKALLAALNDIMTRLEPSQPSLCKAEFFIELAARIWKATPEGDDHNARVNAAVAYLTQLAGWFGGAVGPDESRSAEIPQAAAKLALRQAGLAHTF
jgi:hypothetical protein